MIVRRASTAFFLFTFLFVLCPAPIWATDTLLIPAGSVWKYLDNGSNQGTAWRAAAFNDSTWAAGQAQLGYGDGDEATTVSFGPDPNNKHLTTYFRTTFNVTNPGQFTSLILSMIRDDGAVVYVNGVEVWRQNLPAGNVAYNQIALTAVIDPAVWQTVILSPSFLVPGTNTIAVEIHQHSVTSNSISFDFSMSGTDAALVTRGPYLQSGTQDSVIVRWRTNIATDSQVRFGTTLGSLTGTMTDGASSTEHELKLTGLTPDTKYFYQVGTTSGGLSGNDAATYFHTNPVPGTVRPYRFWVIGDAGTGNAYQAGVRNAFNAFNGSTRVDGWLMLGDNAYNEGLDSEYQSYVFDFYPSIVRTVVSWPSLGNHDAANSANPPPSLPYFQMFNLPMNGEVGGFPSGTEKYYSFDYGNVHFVVLDSTASSRAVTGQMANWLRTDLAQNTKRWTVAYWHHPPYSFSTHDSDTEIDLAEMRANLVPILENAGVDLVLTGHSHAYERSYLIDGHYGTSSTFSSAMKLNPTGGPYYKPGLHPHEGTVYIVAGNSGRSEHGTPPLGQYPAMYSSQWGAGSLVLDVDGDRLDVRLLTDTGAIADTVTINKGAATPPTAPGGLTATPVSASQINLAWTDNSSNEDGFKIERSTDGVNFTQIAVTPPQTAAYPDTGLATATLYYYRVFAYNTAGNSAATTGSATTGNSDTVPPVLSNGSPSGTLGFGTTQASLTVATNETATCRYSTVAATAYSAMTSTFSTTGATSHSTSVTGLSDGNSYNFFVRCLDTAGNANTTDYPISFSVASAPPPPDITTGLKGHWGLNETAGNTASDSSGNNNAGTLINGPAWSGAGRVGGAVSFDGVNDYVSLGNPASLIPGNAITLAGWVKLNDLSINRFFFAKYAGPTPTFLRYERAQGIKCVVGGTGVVAASSVVTGQWYHAGCTYDGATIRVYINGVQVATAPKTGAIADAVGTDWAIGAGIAANGAPLGFMNGLVDEVRLYNRALTAADISQLSNPSVPDTTPPVLSNGGPSGALSAGTTQATLTVATNENATCRYSTVAATAYAAMTSTFSTTGATSHSTSVTGLSDGNSYNFFVRCLDTAANANTTDYTIGFSVASPADTTPPVLSNGGPSGTLALGTTQASLTVATNENATCRYSTVAATAYAAMTNTFSTTGATSHSTPVSGLSNGNSYNFFVRCLDTAGNANTTDYTISFSVASAPPPPDITTGLKGYWALNETAGNTASDSSGNNNAGTLINGPAWSGAGRVGGAVSFDGVNDYVSLGNPASLIPGNAITLAGWVKLNDLSINRFFFAKYAGPTPTFIRYERGQGIKCVVGGTGVVAPASIVTGQWYHTACTYDGATIRVYINGVQVATAAKTGAIADAVGIDWAVGAGIAANGAPLGFMNGLVDEVRLYNRALTPADVALLSNP